MGHRHWLSAVLGTVAFGEVRSTMSTLGVVEQILKTSETALSVRQIVERAGPTLPTRSKTPDTVVARDLSMDIKKQGEASRFVRTAPGRYAMRNSAADTTNNQSLAAAGLAKEAAPPRTLPAATKEPRLEKRSTNPDVSSVVSIQSAERRLASR